MEPTASVRLDSSRSRIDATGYSMMVPTNASTNTTMRMGTAIGSSTRKKAWKCEAPSTLAHSSISTGIVSK